MHAPVLPPPLPPVIDACNRAGGRALLVGGCVRDALMGIAQKDVDVEVHGLDLDQLRKTLAHFGKVSEVGRSFGVLKLRIGRDEFDFSLPRRDSKVGAGHKGIVVIADPELGALEAARRRDLTINAIAYNPATGALVDPFDGRGDIERRVLRAVDAETFGEDPLRALRVAQFAARFGFAVDPDLERLCSTMPLAELPAERVVIEIEKLMLLGIWPSLGWDFAFRTGIWHKVVPPWHRPCPPTLDRLARAAIVPPARRLAVMLAAALKAREVEGVLDTLRLHRWRGYALRAQVHALTGARECTAAGATDSDLRRLADSTDLALYAALVNQPDLVPRATALGVLDGPLPRLLAGRDLAALGVLPGPGMGQLLDALRAAQFDGQVSTVEQARRWAAERLG